MVNFKEAFKQFEKEGKVYESDDRRRKKRMAKESDRVLSPCMEKPISYILWEGR